MALDVSLTLTPPQGGTATVVVPEAFGFDGDINEADAASLFFSGDWDALNDESDTSSAGQINSLLTFRRNSVNEYLGTLRHKEPVQTEDGEKLISMDFLDHLARLGETWGQFTFASGVRDTFTVQTPPLALAGTLDALTPVDLSRNLPTIGGSQWPAFPVTTSVIWQTGNATTLGANINASVTTIEFTSSYAGLTPAGFIKIGTEWIYYDGYDQSGSSNRFRAKNCTRGVLGTTAASHTAGDAVTQMYCSKYHPAVPILVEGYQATDGYWRAIPRTQYSINAEEGRVDFTNDPTTTGFSDNPGNHFTVFRISAAIFDETNTATFDPDNLTGGGRLTLETLLSYLLESASPGPAYSSSDYVLAIGTIVLSRIKVDTPRHTLELIRQLFDELGYLRGLDDDAVGFWYDSPQGKPVFSAIAQLADNAEPDGRLTGEATISAEYSIDQIYSAVPVRYSAGFNFNLLAAGRWYHPQGGDTIGGGTVDASNPTQYLDPAISGTTTPTWQKLSTAGHNNVRGLLTDGRQDTGFGVYFSAAPTGDADVLWGYFPLSGGSPQTFRVSEAKFVIEISGGADGGDAYSQVSHPLEIEVMGVQAYNVATPSSSTGIVHLHPELHYYQPCGVQGTAPYAQQAGNLGGGTLITLTAKNIDTECQAIVFRCKGLMTAGSSATPRLFLIREAFVLGDVWKTKMVRLTNDAATATLNSDYLYAAATYNKLVDQAVAQHRVAPVLEIGQASDNVAASIGKLQLLTYLAMAETKRVVVTSHLPTPLPQKGETWELSNGVRGVVRGRGYRMANGQEELRLSLTNYNSGLFYQGVA